MSEAIRILLFGSLRDRAGRGDVSVDSQLPATVGEAWDRVSTQLALRADIATIRCARNLEYCSWDTPVTAGDELAFMPPVCGGSSDDRDDRVTVALTDQPIDVQHLLDDAGDEGDGAVACFVGRVRNHSDGQPVSALEYEAYQPMALVVMRRIASDACRRHQLTSVAVVHRVGALLVGDVAVVVVTASPHRRAALDACSEVIEAVKEQTPIWKREHTSGGVRWVDARHHAGAHV